jgi:ankyrin repeat protein
VQVSSCCSIDDCFQVESEVIDIAHKWQQFGGALRIRQAKLEEIKAGSGSVPRECLTKTVQEFLKKNYDLQEHGQPSWRQVVIAVGHKAGGADTELALQIANDHPMKAPSKKKSGSASLSLCVDKADYHADRESGSEGRPSVSSPISPTSPLITKYLKLGETYSKEDVEIVAEELTEFFNGMVLKTEKALHDSQVDPRRIVNIIRLQDANLSYVPEDFFENFEGVPDVTGLFSKFYKFWDPFNYFLFERLLLRRATKDLFASHLVNKYYELHEFMLQYKEHMKYFRKHTDVEVYCSSVIKHKLEDREIPKGFKELVEERSNLKTLEDVENFRQEVAYKYKLSECLVFLKKIKYGSVILTFWIPVSSSEGYPITLRDGVQVEPSSHYLSDEPSPPGESWKDESQKEVTFTVTDTVSISEELPPTKKLKLSGDQEVVTLKDVEPVETPSIITGDKATDVAKKRSLAEYVFTTISKLILPKYMFDAMLLMRAVSNGDKADIDSLILKGADPNATPPMIQFTPLMEASRMGYVEITRLLLDNGADSNKINNEGWTALMAAANNGRYGTVDILLQKGANPDMQDDGGWSALMAAVYKRHDEVALRIIQAGATPHLQDKNHTNAILLAIATNEQGRVVEALLERVEDPSQLDLQDSFGETVLIFACKNRNLELVKRLLSMKANPNLCNNHGETPVLISTKWGDTETVQELLDNYADPNMGNTHPLMVAINLGHKEIAKLLVVNGADIYKEHEGGVLAFEMAELRNFTDLARRLNPQQFTSRTPRDVLRLTIKSLATVQKHLSLGPLRLVKTDDKKGWLPGFLQHMLQRTHVQ